MSRLTMALAAGALASEVLLLAACVASGGLPEERPGAPDANAEQTRPLDAGMSSAAEECRIAPSPSNRRDEVCRRWRCDGRDALAPARWNGDLSRCKAGDLDTDAAERAVRLVNLHRFIADVAPVRSEPAWTAAAQECALVAHANTKLSHTPPREWRCWSDVAALTSSSSLIANRSAPPSIAAFIEDPGNESTMVHRRWLLAEELAFIGLGSTDRYACLVVDGRSLDALIDGGAAHRQSVAPDDAGALVRGWVAWPAPGPVPMEVFASEQLDRSGWTIQSANDDLDGATVSVSSSGETLSVRVTHLQPMLGSRTAIRFVPDGWKTEPGRTYVVRVEGVRARQAENGHAGSSSGAPARTIEFTVEPVDCD
jgi:hypothetical protein